MSEDSKGIMSDEECFRCLVRGGVVHSGKIRIALSDMVNDYHVSTVWLGLNHAYRDTEKPLLFETMVFDKSGSDIFMDRYSTWDEAAIGHAEAVNWVKQKFLLGLDND